MIILTKQLNALVIKTLETWTSIQMVVNNIRSKNSVLFIKNAHKQLGVPQHNNINVQKSICQKYSLSKNTYKKSLLWWDMCACVCIVEHK